MSYENLNKKQQEAVDCTEGPLLILAGAGSGKTSTMTHRIAHLVEMGVEPWRILAVTFTNKAAAEMRGRVEELVGQEAAEDMWILTFHSMCLRILRINADRIGYDRGFVIYDSSDQKSLVKSILKDKNINDREFTPQYFLSIISRCKEKALGPQEYADVNEDSYRTRMISYVYSEYQRQLIENNAMDFDDLLLNTYRLFESDEEVLLKYQNRFRYIMVDEYQDTNHLQYELVSMLAERHHNICVVGDDDQCIYQWRGADINNILDFERDFDEAKVIKLEQNYRSVGNILDAANSVIRNNRGRKSKKLWTAREAGDKIRYYRADNDKEEADYVARQISYMVQDGRNYDEFAVLYRTNAQSRLFEEAMSYHAIPYRVLSGMRYYDRKEIKDIMAYMRLIINPKDELSIIRVINEPKRGIGRRTLERLTLFAKSRGQSLFEALADDDQELLDTLPVNSYSKMKEMVDCLKLCRRERENESVSDIYDMILVRTGYLPTLEAQNTIEAESRIDNLMEFKTVIAEYEKDAEQPTLDEFMAQLALTAEVDNYDETAGAVTLMTMHSAKGLEFPVVFLPGLEDGLFPGAKAFDSNAGMEEERRLCYVGMTRAKEKLFLSSAEVRTRYGRTEYTRESQFLREVDKSLLDGTAVYKPKKKTRSEYASSLGGPGVSTGSRDGFSGKSQRPFDALRYAKQSTQKNADRAKAAASVSFQPGDRVSHPKFGEGMVIEENGSIVQVAFDSEGVKKLAKGIAPLRKV